MIPPSAGVILISDPFLKDPNFMRTVVLLCEHNQQGSFGLVLNRPFEQQLNDFIPELEGYRVPVYYGGPVQPDTLHFVHHVPELIPESQAIADGVYWGGSFKLVLEKMRNRTLDLGQIKFFLGYSGWGSGQLTDELTQKSWLTVGATCQLVFRSQHQHTWRQAILKLDSPFHEIANYPIDPGLN
jgi:putative transcriptional regulator